jgi:hypothetical protein
MMARWFEASSEGRRQSSEVTQDKSNCVRQTQIANGDGGFRRVMNTSPASHRFCEIARHCYVYVRLGFVHVLPVSWCMGFVWVNADGRLHRKNWCIQ